MHDLLPSLHGLISGCIAIGLYELLKKRFGGYKYNWTCPKCNRFRVSANKQDVVDRMKATHNCED